jgi:hypothetical protein
VGRNWGVSNSGIRNQEKTWTDIQRKESGNIAKNRDFPLLYAAIQRKNLYFNI